MEHERDQRDGANNRGLRRETAAIFQRGGHVGSAAGGLVRTAAAQL